MYEGFGLYNEVFYVFGIVVIFFVLLVFGVGYMSRKYRNVIFIRNREFEFICGLSECSCSILELGLKDVEI